MEKEKNKKANRRAFAVFVACFVALTASQAFAQSRVLTLEEALKMAREQNYDLRIARERLNQAKASVKEAWTMVQPTIAAYGNYTHSSAEAKFDMAKNAQSSLFLYENDISLMESELSRPDLDAAQRAELEGRLEALREARSGLLEAASAGPITIQKKDTFRAGLTLSQPIFSGMAIPGILIARDSYRSQELSNDMTQEIIEATVAEIYLRTIAAKKLVNAMNRQVENSAKHLELAKARLEVGQLTRLGVSRAELDLENNRYNLVKLETAYRLILDSLALMIAAREPFEVEIPEKKRAIEKSPEELYEEALGKRIDLRLQENSLKINERVKTLYYMSFLPMLNLGASLDWTDSAGFSGKNTSWKITLSLSWTIYDGGKRYSDLDRTRSKIAETNIGMEKLKHNINSQVRTARLNVISAEKALAAAEKQLSVARETSELAEARFSAGMATSLEVSDAANMLAMAETQAISEELNLEIAKLKLEKILVAPVSLSGGESSASHSGSGYSGASSSGSGASSQPSSSSSGSSGASQSFIEGTGGPPSGGPAAGPTQNFGGESEGGPP